MIHLFLILGLPSKASRQKVERRQKCMYLIVNLLPKGAMIAKSKKSFYRIYGFDILWSKNIPYF